MSQSIMVINELLLCFFEENKVQHNSCPFYNQMMEMIEKNAIQHEKYWKIILTKILTPILMIMSAVTTHCECVTIML